MGELVQVSVTAAGESVLNAEQVRWAFEAVGQTVGSIEPEDPDNGVWLVEVGDELAATLTEEGWFTLEHDDWLIEAEMP